MNFEVAWREHYELENNPVFISLWGSPIWLVHCLMFNISASWFGVFLDTSEENCRIVDIGFTIGALRDPAYVPNPSHMKGLELTIQISK